MADTVHSPYRRATLVVPTSPVVCWWPAILPSSVVVAFNEGACVESHGSRSVGLMGSRWTYKYTMETGSGAIIMIYLDLESQGLPTHVYIMKGSKAEHAFNLHTGYLEQIWLTRPLSLTYSVVHYSKYTVHYYGNIDFYGSPHVMPKLQVIP